MKLEIVLIGFVLFFLIVAIAAKQWERYERLKHKDGLRKSRRI